MTLLTGSRTLYALLLALLSSGVAAHSLDAAKPKPNQKAIDALATAQSIYIQQDDLDGLLLPHSHTVPSDDYLKFYNAIQSMDRYQLVPNVIGADLIIRYVGRGYERRADVIEAKTLKKLGEYSAQKGIFFQSKANRLETAARVLKKLKHDISGSAAKPPIPLAPPVDVPKTSQRLDDAHKIFLIHRDFAEAFPAPPPSTSDMTEMDKKLTAEITSWYHYEMVDTLTEADLVMLFSYEIMYDLVDAGNDENGLRVTETHKYPVYMLRIRDAKTLQILSYGFCTPWVTAKNKTLVPTERILKGLFASTIEHDDCVTH